ncbi:MAG: phage portal protein [Lachnospiraceae bacterium]|nr:phage portal protein [Lachnospiraceae bacterium]
MGLFRKKVEIREEPKETKVDSSAVDDALLRVLVGNTEVNRENILNIPSVAACINKISDTVASLDIKLYKRTGDRVEEVNDNRVSLLNKETGDSLTGFQMKKAMVEDMYLGRGGYAFVNKVYGEVQSLHYVEEKRISFIYDTDPIFKDYKISVNDRSYEGFQFIKLLRNTKNGWKGTSILEDSPTLMGVLYDSQKFEQNLVKTGGNKKGFLEVARKISEESLEKLKSAFRRMYSNGTENVIVLNEGIKFQESSNSSVEMQLNENKKTNNDDICKVFLMPPSILNGKASESDKQLYYEGCILPILNNFSEAINSVLLTEDEKTSYFFAFDVGDLIKGDIEKRYKAYEIALKNGFMQLDEVRKNEKLPAFGLDFIKLGLQDVLYFSKTKEIYTPNTNKLSKMGEESEETIPIQEPQSNNENIDIEGGEEENESGNQE